MNYFQGKIFDGSKPQPLASSGEPRGMSASRPGHANFLPRMALCREAQDGLERPLRMAKPVLSEVEGGGVLARSGSLQEWPCPPLSSGYVFMVILLCLLPGWHAILKAQTASGVWSLEDCLNYGLSQHPLLQQSDGAIKSAEANVGQSRSTLGTKVSFQSSFQRSRQEHRRATSAGRSVSSDDLIDSNSDSLGVRKVLTDSGRTKERVKSGEYFLNAARLDKKWQKITVVADIKIAYFRALQTKALISVQEDALNRNQVHLEKVKNFVQIGVRPPYDITKAEVDVANSQVVLIKAQSDFQVALANLSKSVGVEEEISIEPTTTFEKPRLPSIEKANLLEEALGRPDLAAAICRANSSGHSVKAAKKGLSPTLSGGASYDWSGTVSPLDRSWNMNLSVSVPFLDGKLTKFQVLEAEGSFQSVQARVQQLRLAVKSDLEVAISAASEAFKRFDATEILLQQASESLKLAEGRYDAAVGSPIEITDAQTSYSSAQGSYITAFYDCLISLARLDLARGRFPEKISSQ